jgi:hypothetical protein
MNSSDIKKLIIDSLDAGKESEGISGKLENEGISYDFRNGFTDRILDKVFTVSPAIIREIEFTRRFSTVFYRIAITGVAAIILLLISIYFMEGTLSVNSFLGITDSFDESTICLLTGK